jgi:hypothetical protein
MADEKTIIVDEDWKSRVLAEKEAASASQPVASDKVRRSDGEDFGDVPMPPASLEVLLSTLATEALVSLGEVPHPATGKLQVHCNQAKYLIDTIDVIQQKTKGNLTPVEQQTIDNLLYQLRMIFVSKASVPAGPSVAAVRT